MRSSQERGGDRRARPRRWRIALAAVLAAATLVVGAPTAPAGATASGPAPANVEQYTAYYADRVLRRSYQTVFATAPSADAARYWTWRIMQTPSAAWFAAALMASSQYQAGLGKATDAAFVDRVHRNALGRAATADEVTLWTTMFRNRSGSRATLVAHLVERQFRPTLTRPNRPVVACRQFTAAGPKPLCTKGSAGHQRDVDILEVPGTNLNVNRSWFAPVASLVAAGRAAGYDLQGENDPATPSWMYAPGSWRTFDEQQWLYDNGYPANPPGRSMHEWGLAIDLTCNGHQIVKVPRCWNWVRTNGPALGVHIFSTADQVTDKEAWHFSSNGR